MRNAVAVLAVAVLSLAAAAEQSVQRVRLRILDQGKPVSGVEVLIVAPGEGTTNGTRVALTTNAAGFVETDISSTVFWVTVRELNPDVVGKEFRFATKEARTRRWDLHPREWVRDVEGSR